MKIPSTRIILLLATLGLAGGCGTVSTRYEQPLNTTGSTPMLTRDTHYEASIQRGPEYIDALRAEPAPQQPRVIEGKSERGDQRELASKGYVRIGNGRYTDDGKETIAAATELGRSVGADQIWLYHEDSRDNPAEPARSLLAAYYVRFKLLFGATFRDLTATEREQMQLEGGIQIGSVVGGTPASQANLMSGDYVIAVNGEAVVNRRQFQQKLKFEAGKPVTLKVIRNQKRADRVVRLGALPPLIKEP